MHDHGNHVMIESANRSRRLDPNPTKLAPSAHSGGASGCCAARSRAMSEGVRSVAPWSFAASWLALSYAMFTLLLWLLLLLPWMFWTAVGLFVKGAAVIRKTGLALVLESLAFCTGPLRWASASVVVESRPVLPPQLDPGRLCIVLDLDETLIASWDGRAPEASAFLQAGELQCTLMRLPYGPGVTDIPTSTSLKRTPTAHGQALNAKAGDKGDRPGLRYGEVLVVQRPGLRDFLRRLASFAELVLFTAAVPEYAEPVMSQVLDPDQSLFQGRLLYRQHTRLNKLGCIKDLGMLGRDLSRVVLVDNNIVSFLHQPSNGVPCLPFRADPSDRHLSAVLLPLLQSLALFPDVRPILDARFRLAAWFEQRGLTPAPRPGPPTAAARGDDDAGAAGGKGGCGGARLRGGGGVTPTGPGSSPDASANSSDAESTRGGGCGGGPPSAGIRPGSVW